MLIHVANPRRQGERVLGLDQHRLLHRHDVGHSAHRRGDDGNSRRHRLEEDDRCALGPRAEDTGVERRVHSLRIPHHAMPTNAVCDSQFARARLQRELLDRVSHADHRNRERYIVEVRQSLEQHIGPLLRAQPANPTDNKVLSWNP